MHVKLRIWIPFAVGGHADLVRNVDAAAGRELSSIVLVNALEFSSCSLQALAGILSIRGGLR